MVSSIFTGRRVRSLPKQGLSVQSGSRLRLRMRMPSLRSESRRFTVTCRRPRRRLDGNSCEGGSAEERRLDPRYRCRPALSAVLVIRQRTGHPTQRPIPQRAWKLGVQKVSCDPDSAWLRALTRCTYRCTSARYASYWSTEDVYIREFRCTVPLARISEQKAFDMPSTNYGELRAATIKALEQTGVENPESLVETYDSDLCPMRRRG